MTKELFALLMAGTLLIPLITPAGGQGTTTGFGDRRIDATSTLPLPPVPHLETVPWLNSGPSLKGPKVDPLFAPKLDTLGPFLLKPAFPKAQVSVGPGDGGGAIHTE